MHRRPSPAWLWLTLCPSLCLALVPTFGVAVAAQLPTAGAPAAGQPDATPPRVVDRLVAVVDEDPIFLSDLDRAIALSLPRGDATLPAGESTVFPRPLPEDPEALRALRRITLDRLIDQRLRSHEVDRYEMGDVSPTRVEEQLGLLAGEAGGRRVLAERLADLGLGMDGLRSLLRRQLAVLAWVEERLGPRVVVEPEAVEEYYAEILGPEMERRGDPLPPLAEVRGAIRAVLREEALNREIEEWTEELRDEARIVDLFDRDPERPLPPVAVRAGGGRGGGGGL